jgi:hypothetical protein
MGFITSRTGLPYKWIAEDIYVRILGVTVDTATKQLDIKVKYYWSHEARLEEKEHEEVRKVFLSGRTNQTDEEWFQIEQKANFIHTPLTELTFHVPYEKVSSFKGVDLSQHDKIVAMSYEILKSNFEFNKFPIQNI